MNDYRSFIRQIVFISSGLFFSYLSFFVYLMLFAKPFSFESYRCYCEEKKEAYQDLASSFRLEREKTALPSLDIESHLQVVINRAPKREPSLFLLLGGGLQLRQAYLGEQIFLTSSFSGYSFSEEKTSFWIVPTLLKEEKLFFDLCLKIGEEIKVINFSREAREEIKEVNTSSYFKKFVAFLGEDLFCCLEGNDKKDKVRLEMEEGGILYVQEGDFLIFEKGRWCLSSDFREDVPCAYVRKVSANDIQMEGWEEGYKFLFSLDLKPKESFCIPFEDMVDSVWLKTKKRVTISFSGKEFSLKTFQWVFLKEDGWQVPKSLDLFSEKIQAKAQLYFEGIRKEKGKFFFKGYLFDSSRSQMREVALAIGEHKRKKVVK